MQKFTSDQWSCAIPFENDITTFRYANDECSKRYIQRLFDFYSDDSFVEYRQNDSLSFLTSILSGVADEMQNKRQKYKGYP